LLRLSTIVDIDEADKSVELSLCGGEPVLTTPKLKDGIGAIIDTMQGSLVNNNNNNNNNNKVGAEVAHVFWFVVILGDNAALSRSLTFYLDLSVVMISYLLN